MNLNYFARTEGKIEKLAIKKRVICNEILICDFFIEINNSSGETNSYMKKRDKLLHYRRKVENQIKKLKESI